MRAIRSARRFRFCVCFAVAMACFAGSGVKSPGQAAAGQEKPGPQTVDVLFVSDSHFEPFWDPGKAAQLRAAPVTEWKAILKLPEAPDREQRFTALQQSCHARGVDTSYALYESSLRAIRTDAAGAKFAVVSGDLISHSFSCKYATMFPRARADEYRTFVMKTIAFVEAQLRASLPHVPVFAALGNNDSDCGDYDLDAKSEFLEAAGRELTADVPAAERKEAQRTFAAAGYYSVTLPAPMEHTKMLVLDDLFMSRKYATCGGKTDATPAAEQIAWMKQQLDAARSRHEKAWVMSHIPPGVDPYSTAEKGTDICKGNAPTMFLSSEALPEAMAGYGDVVRLAVFGHTHMDEVRLLEPVDGEGMAERGVAVKLVASISPIDGNNPSFTLASINPKTAVMKDYRVIVASNATGADTKWTEEYDFAKTYKQDSFTTMTVRDVIAGFGSDPSAQQKASQSYIRNYGSGMGVLELSQFWKPYVCALGSGTLDELRLCVCHAAQ
jgi:sphingomyelin phosphodiesterase acid-like 3